MTVRTDTVEDDAWYAWGEDGQEQSWLLSYVDVLCVILAMVLVLLVTELRTQPPATASPESAPLENSLEPAPLPVTQETPAHAPFAPLGTSLPPPPVSGILRPVTALPVSEPAPPAPATDIPTDGVQILRDATGMTLQIAEAVLFDSARAELKPTAAPVLERAVILLTEFGEVDVAVQGHTDDRPIHGGPYASNWTLGAARANAVATFLLSRGFPAERLRLESYADTRPITDNGTSEGRSLNRRVEIRVELPPLPAAEPVQRSES